MIVADTTLVVPFIVPHERSAIAVACRRRDEDWIAPPSLRSETINVLFDMMKRGQISQGDAEAGLQQLSDVVKVVDFSPAVDVIRLCVKHRLSGYDAEFAAIALRQGVRVVTDDLTFTERAPGRSAVLMSTFASGR